VIAKYLESPVGPKRKYFSLSQPGREELDCFYSNWLELENAVNKLFHDGGQSYE
jgi:PadR family transcriptional regulator PadR